MGITCLSNMWEKFLTEYIPCWWWFFMPHVSLHVINFTCPIRIFLHARLRRFNAEIYFIQAEKNLERFRRQSLSWRRIWTSKPISLRFYAHRCIHFVCVCVWGFYARICVYVCVCVCVCEPSLQSRDAIVSPCEGWDTFFSLMANIFLSPGSISRQGLAPAKMLRKRINVSCCYNLLLLGKNRSRFWAILKFVL